MDPDFGLVGTVPVGAGTQRVNVAIKGGRLGGDLGRWVKKDEVFALTRISQAGSSRVSSPEPGTLLQVEEEPKEGTCVCRVLSHWGNPLEPGPRTQGFRCLKLGTTRAPVRLRLLKDTTDKRVSEMSAQMVDIRAGSFQDKRAEQLLTKRDGRLQSEQSYQHVAFVSVPSPGGAAIQFPVAIFDEHEIVRTVNVDPKSEARAQLERQKNSWMQDLSRSSQGLNSLFPDLNRLKDKPEEALSRAGEGLTTLRDELDQLQAKQVELTQVGVPNADMAEGNQKLRTLQEGKKKLEEYVAEVQRILQLQSDPAMKKLLGKLAQAKALEGEHEYRQALALLEEAAVDSKKLLGKVDAKLSQQLKELHDVLEPKDKAHAAALDFIYKTPEKLEDPAEIRAQVEKARTAFEACRSAGDKLSPQKLHLILFHYNTALVERKRMPGITDEEAKEVVAVDKELQKLDEELLKFLGPTKPKAK
jgi:hypothetical protein